MWWCVNARGPNGERVGVLSKHQEIAYLNARFPDLSEYVVCGFCPVWVKDAITVWKQWSHLQGFPLRFAWFYQPQTVVTDAYADLIVEEFAEYFNPFRLTQYLWGIREISKQEVRMVAASVLCLPLELSGRTVYDNDKYEYHLERIAQLVKYGWPRWDSVTVTRKPPFHYSLDDGTHRFAAAIIRKDKYIRASSTKDLIRDLLNAGIAVPVEETEDELAEKDA